MKITRLYSGDDNESHFDEIEIPQDNISDIGRLSDVQLAQGVVFRENDADYNLDWHNAPQRQYVVFLNGEVEIEIGDGSKRRFRGGDVLLAEDTTGRGHKSRNIGETPRKSIFVVI